MSHSGILCLKAAMAQVIRGVREETMTSAVPYNHRALRGARSARLCAENVQTKGATNRLPGVASSPAEDALRARAQEATLEWRLPPGVTV
ncbi:hypothetical protein NDU88_002806 [Pleurodeles waltl]|uniref:Uncharacterized protein n=1 Tax=Pleurodeles waltl TaxID=8319 RepID=A0AAV7WM79_PLEWA|nr:hypothetical protein NDU88_002806 [Pleurodeles waltl]